MREASCRAFAKRQEFPAIPHVCHALRWLDRTRLTLRSAFLPAAFVPRQMLCRTASLRHLTERQYRRITAHEALRWSDGHDEDGGASDRPPFSHHPREAGGTPCPQNASNARKHGSVGKQLKKKGCVVFLGGAGREGCLIKHAFII